jgi:hypothetical protein
VPWRQAAWPYNPAYCPFKWRGWLDFASPLTEVMLLGGLALRTGRKIEWDAQNMRAKNCPDADRFIRREYRKGWEA